MNTETNKERDARCRMWINLGLSKIENTLLLSSSSTASHTHALPLSSMLLVFSVTFFCFRISWASFFFYLLIFRMTRRWQQGWLTQCAIHLKEDLPWYSHTSFYCMIANSNLWVAILKVLFGAGSYFPRKGATSICCYISAYGCAKGTFNDALI